MTSPIFVNLPVSDLEASKAFSTALGYSTSPNFTDKTAAWVVLSDTIYAMLPTYAKFADRQGNTSRTRATRQRQLQPSLQATVKTLTS
jgi:predicted lactoylglutathione lyase